MGVIIFPYKEFKTKVALADSDVVPPILGRYKALDLFEVSFNGRVTKFTFILINILCN